MFYKPLSHKKRAKLLQKNEMCKIFDKKIVYET